MANTYDANTGLILQTNGDNSGTWGNYVNTNTSITASLVGGVSTQTVTTTDVTPANVNGTADAGKNVIFVCSGTLTGNRNLILPTQDRQFIVQNNCTGAFTLTVKTASGTGVVIPQAGALHLYCDGTNILNVNSGLLATVGNIDGVIMGATTPCNAMAYGTVNVQTGTTYAPVLTDNGKTITLNNAGAITLTIPANGSVAFPVGAYINLVSLGAGIVTIAITSDTLVSKGSKVTLTGQYSVGAITKVATTTWVLAGDLA